jgi:hypothetical protein
MRFAISLTVILILIPSVAAQENASGAGTLVLAMGFLVLLVLIGLLLRVMLIKQPVEPVPVSLPPAKPQPIDEGRVYGELVVVDGLSSKNRILVTKPDFAIGRGLDNNDYELNLPGISRQHIVLRLDVSDNRMYITDLASANGTVVNGKPLNPNQPHPLYNGDEIVLSHVILRWKSLHGAETQERPTPRSTEDRRTKAIPLPDKDKPEEQW